MFKTLRWYPYQAICRLAWYSLSLIIVMIHFIKWNRNQYYFAIHLYITSKLFLWLLLLTNVVSSVVFDLNLLPTRKTPEEKKWFIGKKVIADNLLNPRCPSMLYRKSICCCQKLISNCQVFLSRCPACQSSSDPITYQESASCCRL